MKKNLTSKTKANPKYPHASNILYGFEKYAKRKGIAQFYLRHVKLKLGTAIKYLNMNYVYILSPEGDPLYPSSPHEGLKMAGKHQKIYPFIRSSNFFDD